MMYCTLDDLKKRLDEEVLVRLTDDTGTGEIDQAVVEEVIAQAQAEIDGYLEGRYQVPLEPVPVLLRRLCADIAVYLLFSRRGLEEAGPDGVVWKAYQAARDTLSRMAKGEIRIGSEVPPARPEILVESSERVFSREKLGEW